MGILLPLTVFCVLYGGFRLSGGSTREAMLRSVLFCATAAVAAAELLSIPDLLTRNGLIVAWLMVLAGAALYFRFGVQPAPRAADPLLDSALHLPRDIAAIDRLLSVAVVAILAVLGLVAIVAPPNSWDVMEHHLPRVLFWVSNHTLRPFPTPDYTQLLVGAGAESITLNTYLLWGSDRLVNLVEFCSLFGSAVAVSLIASRFGARRTGQLIAALFVVTIPEALLESSGSMTTSVVSFWTVTACFFLIRAGAALTRWDVIAAALSTGLALLTRETTFAYLPVLLLGCVLFRPPSVRLWMLKQLPLFVLLVLAINAGQFVRNWEVSGNPLAVHFRAGGPRLDFVSDHITPAAIAANVLRQTTLQAATPSSSLNARMETLTRKAISLLGQDPDDPRASWSGLKFYIDHPTRLETQAGNPVHFAIIVACFAVVFFLKWRLKDNRVPWFAASIVFAFIVFCAFIRWQPWGSRFHQPLFIVAAAVVGATAERVFTRRWQIVCFAAFLVVIALPYLVSNSTRSILRTKNFPTIFEPREELYFADQHTAQAPVTLALADAIRASGCGRIALDAYLPHPEPEITMSPPSFYIYPLLAQLGVDGRSRFVHYIGVQNPTKRFTPTSAVPPDCAVVCLSCRLSQGKKSDAGIGRTLIFGNNELVFPATTPFAHAGSR